MSQPNQNPADHLADGVALHRAGRHADAEAAYRRALEADPTNVDALHFLAALAFDLGRLDVARPLIEQALAHAPAAAEIRFTQGNIEFAAKNPKAALAAFREAVRLRPDYAEAWSNLAVAARGCAEIEESAAAARQAATLAPMNAAVRLAHAIAADYKDDLKTTIAESKVAIALDPALLDAYSYLGDALLRLGHFPPAIQAFAKSLALAPDRAEMHNNLGHALRESGEPELSEPLFRRALEMRPGYPEAFYNLNSLRVDRHFRERRTGWRRANPDPAVTTDQGGHNPPGPIVIECQLTPEECRTIMALAPSLPEYHAVVGVSKGVDAEAVRRSNIRWVELNDRTRFIYDKVMEALFKANDERFGFPIASVEQMQLAQYDESERGFYDWHFDTLYYPRPEKPVRRLSISMQLTPPHEYEGGDLLMKTADGVITASRDQGAAIVFASSMLHRVDPVEKGCRYSLVMWASGRYIDGC